MSAAVTVETLNAFLDDSFPQVCKDVRLEALPPMGARVRLRATGPHLRPGGTVSGPAMMMLVDVSFYLALLGQIGLVPLAVTTNLNINFLRKPEPGDLIGEARILKLGKRLAVGDVTIAMPDEDTPLAHATLTYAIPPR